MAVERARALMLDAVNRMGCQVLTVTTRRGQPAWV